VAAAALGEHALRSKYTVFPRRERLPRDEFPSKDTRVYRVSSPFFVVSQPTQGQGYAVVVAKKAVRRSVDRHRLKRRVIAALRTLPLPTALVVYPRAAAQSLDFAATQAELGALLSKIQK
jgi:ribonuclease P protein component